MSCDSNGAEFRYLVDIITDYGTKQVCALLDTGAMISLIQPNLNPKIYESEGYLALHGYQANSSAQQAKVVTVMISLDGVTWQKINAALTDNMSENMILSPQALSNYRFTVSGEDLTISRN